MDQRSAFLLQIIEKLGLPLMAAVADVSGASGNADAKKEAERVAELLGRCVQSSISLATLLDLRDTDGSADSVRLALAALSSELLAAQYRVSRRMPGEKDLERLGSSLTAVLAFAENFAPVAKNTARLRALDIEELAFDEYQVNALFFSALAPAIGAIAAYPFGRPETKLVQEVAGRISTRVKDLRKKLCGDTLQEEESRQIELSLFKALVGIYAECHKGETNRLLAMSESDMAQAIKEDGGVLSMEPVWKAFETRVAMLEAVSNNLLPAGARVSGGAKAPTIPLRQPAAQSAPVTPPAGQSGQQPPAIFRKKPAEAETVAVMPAQTSEALSQEAPQSSSPMAFFKPGIKKSGSEEGEA